MLFLERGAGVRLAGRSCADYRGRPGETRTRPRTGSTGGRSGGGLLAGDAAPLAFYRTDPCPFSISVKLASGLAYGPLNSNIPLQWGAVHYVAPSVQFNAVSFVGRLSRRTAPKTLHRVTEGEKKSEIPALSPRIAHEV